MKEAEAGAVVNELYRKHGMSSATYYAWKAKFGGLEVSDETGAAPLRHRGRALIWAEARERMLRYREGFRPARPS